MVGLRLDDFTVAGVCTTLDLDVPAGTVRAAIVRHQQAVHDLANAVVGLTKPARGMVLVDDTHVGEQHTDHRRRRRHRLTKRGSKHCRIRLVPASGGLMPELALLGNMLHAQCPTARISQPLAAAMVSEIASSCGLLGLLDACPEDLDPTERRLAGLALALGWEPSAVVLEDAAGLPTWDAVLDLRRRRLGLAASADPSALFTDVAVLLITTDAARARELDDDPIGLEPQGIEGLGKASGRGGVPVG
ncbi:hypothetical protein [Actinopolymorpha alba]|uniref:hypothetical protein n=1 Tax=Actinopolymorpha alba TaxID=533267 RepID=UPI000381C506|nr:hypothetical protein [Actinopolymorpha alba]